jgi:hypothetical protein
MDSAPESAICDEDFVICLKATPDTNLLSKAYSDPNLLDMKLLCLESVNTKRPPGGGLCLLPFVV